MTILIPHGATLCSKVPSGGSGMEGAASAITIDMNGSCVVERFHPTRACVQPGRIAPFPSYRVPRGPGGAGGSHVVREPHDVFPSCRTFLLQANPQAIGPFRQLAVTHMWLHNCTTQPALLADCRRLSGIACGVLTKCK